VRTDTNLWRGEDSIRKRNNGKTGVQIILKGCSRRIHIEVSTQEAVTGIECWNMGIWRLKDMRGNTEQGNVPLCIKEEGWNHILRCEETRSWREGVYRQKIHSY
jgi:hypothetical protein